MRKLAGVVRGGEIREKYCWWLGSLRKAIGLRGRGKTVVLKVKILRDRKMGEPRQ